MRAPTVDPARPAPSISQQIAELTREQAMRRNVYPRLIGAGKLRDSEARYQMDCLQAAIDSLWRLRAPAAPERDPDT